MNTVAKLKKHIGKIILIAATLLIAGLSLYLSNFYKPDGILKTAVRERELSDENYVLCKRMVTTGFDWVMVKDEDGNKTYTFCNISGVSPFADLNLNADFVFGNNTYVLYFEEKEMVYSEASGKDELEFVVTGWDILLPIKRNTLLDLFCTSKYITKNDLGKE